MSREILLFRLEWPTRRASDAWTGRSCARRPVTWRQRGRSARGEPASVGLPSTRGTLSVKPTKGGCGFPEAEIGGRDFWELSETDLANR